MDMWLRDDSLRDPLATVRAIGGMSCREMHAEKRETEVEQKYLETMERESNGSLLLVRNGTRG